MEPDRLIDGETPRGPDELFARLDELGIEHVTLHHPPVFTVEEAKALRGEIEGAHIKNLFLRNKKGEMWLLVCPESRPVDLKALRQTLGTTSLSFARPGRLMQYLGVIPGAVTPLAILNDQGGAVTVLIDEALRSSERINCHPLDNARTTSLRFEDLIRFLEAEDHPPRFLEL